MSAKTFPIDCDTPILLADGVYTNRVDCDKLLANKINTVATTATLNWSARNASDVSVGTGTVSVTYQKIGRFLHIYVGQIFINNVGVIRNYLLETGSLFTTLGVTVDQSAGSHIILTNTTDLAYTDVDGNGNMRFAMGTLNTTSKDTTGTFVEKRRSSHTIFCSTPAV